MPPHIKAATPVDAYIGEKIRGLRNQRGISQDRLGELLGVSFQQVQKYETGANRLAGSRLQQVADIFECSIADLFPPNTSAKRKGISNLDRLAAMRDGIKLVNSFVAIKNEDLRAAVVDLAMRFAAL
jgi:transcriptional regulator with XRE-family HTH domain